MPRVGCTTIVMVFAGLVAATPAFAQVRDRYDNSLNLQAPLSRQQRPVVNNAPRQRQPDNCNPALPIDKVLGCTEPDRVSAPPPTVPCTPKTALRNPDLGALPDTCP